MPRGVYTRTKPCGGGNKGKGKNFLWLEAHADHQGDNCLIWPFARDDKGYGIMGYLGKSWRASRLMCTLAHGPAPSDAHQAAHSCARGHDACVHPDHLSWKTPAGNTQDAVRHGRYGFSPYGSGGKLNLVLASEIRALSDHVTNTELGLIYGVHAETIAKVRRGETWTPKQREKQRSFEPDEIAAILDGRKNKIPVPEIAAKLNRTPRSIYSKIRRIG